MIAYLVVGPEASGNRYFTRLLCNAGCAGAGSTTQPFDGPNGSIVIPEPYPEKVTIIRSFPHGDDWVLLDVLVKQLTKYGYKTIVFVMIRDLYCTIQSQLTIGHTETEDEAFDNIQTAYKLIVAGLCKSPVDFFFVGYSNLGREKYVSFLFKKIGLTYEVKEPFQNGDNKYLL